MSSFPPILHCIGLMTGTSMDGLDAVYAQISTHSQPWAITKWVHLQQKFDPTYKTQVFQIIANNQLKQAHLLGLDLAKQSVHLIQELLAKANIRASEIDCIGTHGQTLLHHPFPDPMLGLGFTIQTNNISYIAQHTNIDTVGNFRQKDISLNGQGAPMVPFAHAKLFGQKNKTIAVQNIGGMSNLTLLHNDQVILGFDNGPGNIWIDTVIAWHTQGKQSMDESGKLAIKGKIKMPLVEKLMQHPYFQQKPPKSTGFEMFGAVDLQPLKTELLALPLEDAMATVTYASSRAIVDAYTRWILPDHKLEEIILCGGGAKNQTLNAWIQKLIPLVHVHTTDSTNIDPTAVETLCFGILAASCKYKVPNSLPSVTGALQASIGGEIAWG